MMTGEHFYENGDIDEQIYEEIENIYEEIENIYEDIESFRDTVGRMGRIKRVLRRMIPKRTLQISHISHGPNTHVYLRKASL